MRAFCLLSPALAAVQGSSVCLALERPSGASRVLLYCHGTSSDLGMSRFVVCKPSPTRLSCTTPRNVYEKLRIVSESRAVVRRKKRKRERHRSPPLIVSRHLGGRAARSLAVNIARFSAPCVRALSFVRFCSCPRYAVIPRSTSHLPLRRTLRTCYP